MVSRYEGHSAIVRGWLHVAEKRIPLAQVGPAFCVLRGSHTCGPTQAVLIYHIDGIETRRSVFLPRGISTHSKEVVLKR